MISRFMHPLSLPTIRIKIGTEDFKANMLPNKCSIILIQQSAMWHLTDQMKAVNNLMASLPDVATCLIIVGNTLLPPVATPVIVLSPPFRLVHYRCAMSEQTISLTRDEMFQSKHYKEDCSFHGDSFLVGYNQVAPFLEVSNTDTLPPQTTFLSGFLEEDVLRTFILHHNLNVRFKYAGHKWGSLDTDTGRWNGVVGMVGTNSEFDRIIVESTFA